MVSNTAWKSKGRDLSAWGHATTYGSASTMPSGAALSVSLPVPALSGSGPAQNGHPRRSPVYVLYQTGRLRRIHHGRGRRHGRHRFGLGIHPQGDTEHGCEIILIPEGTYDFRRIRNAVTEATAAGRTWCSSSCGSSDSLSSNTYYRIAFAANSCASLGTGLTIVKESDGLKAG